MAHPYAKHAADKVGKARARSYQSGGMVNEPLPAEHPHARSQWERLSMPDRIRQRDYDRQRGLGILKAIGSRTGGNTAQAGQALMHSDLVPRGQKKED